MKNDSLRIAFIGAHGTGKTTLAKILAEKLDIPLISEGVREKKKQYDKTGLNINEFFNPKGSQLIFSNFQHELLIERIYDENEKVHFVSDRSTIDNFAYYATSKYSEPISEKTFKAYEYLCLQQAKKYTHIFLISIAIIPENDGVRDTTYKSQLIVENFIRGFCEKNNIKFIELKSNSIENRINEVLKVVQIG
jgi:nicotinamide riboside kinase